MDFTGKTLDFFTNVLCPTPRASYHEELIAGKLVDFAGGRGLACLRDGKNNVVVYKPGTGKYEGSSVPVVLQAHTDMVCVPATADFSRGVEAYYSGDNRLTGRSAATGEKTSLGADDGIGAAAIMAVLDSGRELAHPPLVALFTAEEECGLTGARDISMEDVVGICAGLNFGRAAFINLDDGRFGQFSVGCAGSANVTVRIPAERENFAPNGLSYFELAVGGLAGGHSGLSIHENRGNANILLCAAIRKIRLSGAEPFVLGLGRCGDAANAIPSAASACVAVPVKQVAKLREAVAETESAFKETYRASDPGVRLELRECWNPDGSAPYSGRTVSALTTLAAEIDDGPIAYSAAATGLVETSSNLGIMREEGRHIELTFMARSSIDAEREKTVAGILREAERVGAEAEAGNRSPGWAYREKSVLRDLFLDKYRELFGEEATATPVHAGLECGHFAEKFRNLGFDGTDFISCGPTITEIHSVNETLHTDTVEKFGKLLIEVLANLYS